MLWSRSLFFKTARLFLFLIVSIFTLYVMVDLSIHGVKFLASKGSTFESLILYYLAVFAKHFELFSSLSFLLSSLKGLLDLSTRGEAIALQMAGISKKKLTLPFFVLAGFLSLLCYVNNQWFLPKTQENVSTFLSSVAKKKKKEKRANVNNISLEDQTELIYQRFDKKKKEFFDVFWIRSCEEVWHMKYLYVGGHPFEAQYVDCFSRNSEGQFEKTKSLEALSLPKFRWNREANLHQFIPFENRSIRSLFQESSLVSGDQKGTLTHLHYKLAMPLLFFILIFTLAPVSFRFSREKPLFLIVFLSLFAFVSFIALMESMLILGENKVILPSLSIWLPISFVSIFSLSFFSKMR